MFLVRGYTKEIMKLLKLQQNSSFRKIIFTSLLGVYTHILLDSPLYADIKPFYPLNINPLYNQGMIGFDIYAFCIIAFVLSFGIYMYGLISKLSKS
jgi:membrane-bound metal-dependent hydrolase YbcI (DUF457 family)